MRLTFAKEGVWIDGQPASTQQVGALIADLWTSVYPRPEPDEPITEGEG